MTFVVQTRRFRLSDMAGRSQAHFASHSGPLVQTRRGSRHVCFKGPDNSPAFKRA